MKQPLLVTPTECPTEISEYYEPSDEPLKSDVVREVSTNTAIAIMYNFMVGTGVQMLPYSFVHAGWILATLSLLVCSFFSFLCLTWIPESISRASALRYRSHLPNPQFRIESESTFRYTRMSRLFSGRPGWRFTQLSLLVYGYGVLWSYVSVFSSNFVNVFDEYMLGIKCDVYDLPNSHNACHFSYYVVCVVYGIIVAVLANMEIGEQAGFQVFLTIYRFFAFALMLLTVLIAMWIAPAYRVNTPDDHIPYLSGVKYQFRISGFVSIFTTAAVALNVQYNFPDIVYSLKDKSKENIHKVLVWGIFLAFITYCAIGIIIGLYFGDAAKPVTTLNWKDYTGLWKPTNTNDESNIPVWVVFIRLIVILYPAFAMISSFPLIAITIGNNLKESIYPFLHLKKFSDKSIHYIGRLGVSIPPLILGTFAYDLSEIFIYTGICAYLLELWIPTLLQYYSKKRVIDIWGEDFKYTDYSSRILSNNSFVFIAFLFGVLATILALLNVFFPGLFE